MIFVRLVYSNLRCPRGCLTRACAAVYSGVHRLRGLSCTPSLSAALATVPNVFVPDSTFRGSSLAGWHTLGQAQWRAENGEIVGTPAQGGNWLILDKSYQDVGFFASFRSTGGSKTGVLLRAEKTEHARAMWRLTGSPWIHNNAALSALYTGGRECIWRKLTGAIG